MTEFTPADAAATHALGANLGRALEGGAVVYLQGELGAGKTTFVRGVLDGLGFKGHVRSPTYTLVEGYEIDGHHLYHLDLYRIRGTEELEYLGIRELDAPELLVFVEWPERANGSLPVPDLILGFELQEPGRKLSVQTPSKRGRELARAWQAGFQAATQLGSEQKASNV